MDKNIFAVYETVIGFFQEEKVACDEDVFFSESVANNSLEFIQDLFDKVQHDPRIKKIIKEIEEKDNQ